MAEPKEPKRPPPPGAPGGPLPRIWKVEPDADPVEEETPAEKKKKAKAEKAAKAEEARAEADRKKAAEARKARKAKEKAKAAKVDGEKNVLLEETPVYDTYETRQRVRIAVGAGLLGLFVLIGFVIYRTVAPAGDEEEPIPREILAMPETTGNPRERAEQESRILFERAHEVAKNGRGDLAVAILKKVTTAYANPLTQAAVEAKEALERPKQNLPLFLDRPAVVATPVAKSVPPATPKEPARVVEATKTTVAPAKDLQASIVQPANPAEPPRLPAPTPMPPPGVPVTQEAPTRPLPAGFQPRPKSGVHASGWPLEIVGDRDGAPMVLVAGGTFIQGRDDAELAEGPAHRVTLGTYYVDQHEVTARQFRLFEKEAGKRSDRVRALAKGPTAAADSDDERPAVMVSAREASDYCAWAGKRLPTEAQWEAAARTTDGRIFPWGPEPPAWDRPRAPRQIDPVLSYPTDSSPYGAFDLAGNAWEWTKDWYDPKYYQQFRATPADNPAGPVNRPRSQQLVVKGSSKDWHVSKREGIKFDTRLPYLGFRGVLTVEGPGNAFEPPPAPNQPAGAPAQAGTAVPF